MKLKNTLLTIISCAFLATGAQAVIYTDLDLYNGWTGQLVNAANPLTGYFQISYQDNDGINDLVGYDSKTEQIAGVIASFWLYDDSWLDGPEKVTITLGSDTFVNDQYFLFALGGVTGSALFDLDEDGVLAYSILATQGDFKAHKGFLAACTQPRAVPDDGATATLLGMGFLGICAFQRRKLALAR